MSGSEVRFDYVCPRCGASMTARAADAGTRAQCSACGSFAKVPGNGATTAQSAPPPLPAPTAGRRSADGRTWVFPCPHCGASLSAGRKQADAICPECLENVVVPAGDERLESESLEPGAHESETLAPDAPKTDALELGGLELGTLEPDALETGELEPDALELGALEPGALEPGALEPGALEPDSLELGALEPGTLEPDSLEPDSLELGALEPGTLEPGALEPDALALNDREPLGTEQQRAAEQEEFEEFIDEFGFLCPVCGTRLVATLEQVGQTTTCPDCHSRVPIKSPSRTTRRRRAREQDAGEEEEYQIAPPVERTAGYTLDSETLESLRRASEAKLPRDEELADELADAQFAYVCSGCKSRLYAAMDDLGQLRRCPECGVENRVERSPAPLFPQQAIDSEGAKAARQRWKGESSSRPPSEGDDALKRARDELRRSRDAQDELEGVPAPQAVLEFLIQPPTLLRMIPLALGIWLLATLVGGAIAYWDQGALALVSLLFGIFAFFLGLGVVISMAVFCQVVVGDTANGNRNVTNWPEGLITEWWVDSLFMLSALFFSSLPGVLFGQLTRVLGAPFWLLLFFALLSIWLLFPPVLLSMLETGSPLNPVSLPIWRSFQSASRRWLTFYGITAGLTLVLFFQLLMFLPGWLLLNVLAALLATATFMIYARLLGYLAWSCQDEFWPEAADQQRAARPAKGASEN